MDSYVLTPQAQNCLQELMRIWFDFERRLGKVPIVTRLQQGRLTLEDYRKLLCQLRQQVIEGSRWITRCASSFNKDFADVRSQVIQHALEEHRDYELLERDFVAAGGTLKQIQTAPKNPGSEALHGFMMHRASQENPIDLIGAMWIIEGLGNKMAKEWASAVDEHLGHNGKLSSFMHYHGENDEHHMEKLYALLDRVCAVPDAHRSITRTAKVVARLYALQLEEVDNDE